ncbi:MAG: hypothetical protein KatS3mg131_3142 [Candidatus Tectimicrobiota bacterium]|nr:MAG: hypothetical protein KatS3mg131_3142 [Candidatus Tectomicrobia bacterium]
MTALPEPFPPCTCPRCQALCRRPCWPTPAEAEALLAAGYGPQLMLAWWPRPRQGEILVLCPAVTGREGFCAPAPEDWEAEAPGRRCVMQTPEGLCRLHALGLKPLEGRLASGCAPYPGWQVRQAIAALWDTPEGKAVVDRWRQDAG